MMSQLRTLERVDRVHRQKSLAKMPVSQGLLVLCCSVYIYYLLCVAFIAFMYMYMYM